MFDFDGQKSDDDEQSTLESSALLTAQEQYLTPRSNTEDPESPTLGPKRVKSVSFAAEYLDRVASSPKKTGSEANRTPTLNSVVGLIKDITEARAMCDQALAEKHLLEEENHKMRETLDRYHVLTLQRGVASYQMVASSEREGRHSLEAAHRTVFMILRLSFHDSLDVLRRFYPPPGVSPDVQVLFPPKKVAPLQLDVPAPWAPEPKEAGKSEVAELAISKLETELLLAMRSNRKLQAEINHQKERAAAAEERVEEVTELNRHLLQTAKSLKQELSTLRKVSNLQESIRNDTLFTSPPSLFSVNPLGSGR